MRKIVKTTFFLLVILPFLPVAILEAILRTSFYIVIKSARRL